MRCISIQIKLSLLSLTIGLAPLIAQPDADFFSKTNEYMNAQMRASLFSGSILVAQGGKVLVTKGYGMARREPNVPNATGTKFRLTSITHQFTAMAILELKEEGRLDIQDSVCKYIPECPQNWWEIKIINLLTHTSGISDFPDDDRTIIFPAMFPQLLAHFKNMPLEFKPGEKLIRSNFGYELLTAVIENASGQPYTKYLEKHIFEPLGMHDTGYDDITVVIPRCASGYKLSEAIYTLVNATCQGKSIPDSSGGLYSTVEDIYRWDRALYTGKLVSKNSFNQMFTPYRDGYGFGWKILKEFQRKAFVYAGRTKGFSTSIRRYSDDDACIIVLSNMDNVDAEKIGHDLGAILFDAHYGSPMDRHAIQ
jgi:CubicO group peptidase (beta-lactamase class C family)